ncbi:hypothetical protein CBM2587_A20276 [Cupriavidus taiwanensis]|uniref:Uncharacterized protein n=1 Tax=Cupriavidus taiwanensis TaxID=164546 RepID=A0A975WZQ0_9BURK|nr:hypothetical protein CBM2587_A20276 [Cupriavidus taiwanensis]
MSRGKRLALTPGPSPAGGRGEQTGSNHGYNSAGREGAGVGRMYRGDFLDRASKQRCRGKYRKPVPSPACGRGLG